MFELKEIHVPPVCPLWNAGSSSRSSGNVFPPSAVSLPQGRGRCHTPHPCLLVGKEHLSWEWTCESSSSVQNGWALGYSLWLVFRPLQPWACSSLTISSPLQMDWVTIIFLEVGAAIFYFRHQEPSQCVSCCEHFPPLSHLTKCQSAWEFISQVFSLRCTFK